MGPPSALSRAAGAWGVGAASCPQPVALVLGMAGTAMPAPSERALSLMEVLPCPALGSGFLGARPYLGRARCLAPRPGGEEGPMVHVDPCPRGSGAEGPKPACVCARSWPLLSSAPLLSVSSVSTSPLFPGPPGFQLAPRHASVSGAEAGAAVSSVLRGPSLCGAGGCLAPRPPGLWIAKP